MRVLQLPDNIASQMSVLVRGLRALKIEARGLTIYPKTILSSKDDLETIDMTGTRRQRLFKTMRYLPYVFAAIRWADVIHWHFGTTALPRGIDLAWARLLKKPGVVEFWGSDIRIPEVEAADNFYYKQVQASYDYQGIESRAQSLQRQRLFARAGVEALTSCKSMMAYIQPALFPEVHFVRQRVFVSDYTPAYPDPAITRPKIVHSPTAPVTKGTAAVLSAIEQLQASHALDFQLVQKMPRAQALQVMQGCDIFVDQLVLGAHGLASLEAMACGKPVVCYIKPSMVGQYPAELPIVNATKETLPEVLARLIEDGQLRHELGRQGRAYVEQYHDALRLTAELVDIYRGL